MIKVFKLMHGEEIIAMTQRIDFGFELTDPAAIIIQQTKEGIGVALAPYMPYAESKITLYESAIGTEGIPNKNLEKEYNKIFGSKIELVPASALNGLKIVN
jgi:hypothetical protein